MCGATSDGRRIRAEPGSSSAVRSIRTLRHRSTIFRRPIVDAGKARSQPWRSIPMHRKRRAGSSSGISTLNVNGERRFEHGWLAYKEAETPEQLASARPVKLVTARGYDPMNDQSAGRTKSRLAGPAVIRIHELNRGLARCAAVSEPGVLAKPDALYLALICFRGSLFGLFEVS